MPYLACSQKTREAPRAEPSTAAETSPTSLRAQQKPPCPASRLSPAQLALPPSPPGRPGDDPSSKNSAPRRARRLQQVRHSAPRRAASCKRAPDASQLRVRTRKSMQNLCLNPAPNKAVTAKFPPHSRGSRAQTMIDNQAQVTLPPCRRRPMHAPTTPKPCYPRTAGNRHRRVSAQDPKAPTRPSRRQKRRGAGRHAAGGSMG